MWGRNTRFLGVHIHHQSIFCSLDVMPRMCPKVNLKKVLCSFKRWKESDICGLFSRLNELEKCVDLCPSWLKNIMILIEKELVSLIFGADG